MFLRRRRRKATNGRVFPMPASAIIIDWNGKHLLKCCLDLPPMADAFTTPQFLTQ